MVLLTENALGGLGSSSLSGLRSGFELGIRMIHGFAPAFLKVSGKGLRLCVGAAKFLDHAVDFFQLHSVVPRNSDGFLLGIQYDLYGSSPLKLAFFVETLR